jgi:hypothetical protein
MMKKAFVLIILLVVFINAQDEFEDLEEVETLNNSEQIQDLLNFALQQNGKGYSQAHCSGRKVNLF